MKHIRALLLCTALMLLVFSASAQEPVEIKISTWAGAGESAELQELIDEVNAEQSEFRIVHEPIPSDYYTQVKTQIAGGTGADLYWMDQNNMSLASEGVFLALDECLADSAAQSAGDLSDYYPSVLAVNQFEGETYGLPWIAQPVVLFYNKDMFDAAGIEYPSEGWDWNEFTEKAKALTQDLDGDGATDQWGFINNGWPPPYIFIWQAGGETINADFTESPIDTPEFVEGFEFFLSTAYNPEMSPSREVISEQGFGEMFKAGKIAMFMGGASDDFDFNSPGINVGVTTVPAHPETGLNTTFAWNASTVINAATENPEAACAALVALTEKIHTWKVMSPRISQATVEHLTATAPGKAPNAQAYIDAAATMRALPIFGNYAEWDGLFWSEFWGPLMNNETDLTVAELAAEVRFDLEDTLP